PAVMQTLLQLADECQVMPCAQAMFHGAAINATEQRPVLHVALRGGNPSDAMGPVVAPWGAAISAEVQRELMRFTDFAEHLRQGARQGFNGQNITDVVNLGIGGSDLGPRMATEALTQLSPDLKAPALRVHFVSNVDPWSLATTLAPLDPGRTLFIVQSKTFTTQETMTLAASAKRWLQDAGCTARQLPWQLVAVTAQPALAQANGFLPEQCFVFWDWVGGRYSVWSAIGLPLAIAIGKVAFLQMLAGGQAMDRHFTQAPAAQNLPLQMALWGVWNRNFLGATTHHVAPYAAPLGRLMPFLQQLEMESNGKRVHVDGSIASVDTAPVLWGGLGIDGQHAYFQLLHQGQHLVPIDFIGVRQGHAGLPLSAVHQRVVLLNLQAQAQALALGRSVADTVQMLRDSGMDAAQAQALAAHRSFAGNVPSTVLWLEELTPHSLGALIALYEHKVFCQAALWGIHAYDQWGVELGKTMAKAMESGH
ncbi:MAG: glucose-6-phosphate isomerase, partial [Betaproteobacteria bacterium]|nr:glucose-6-phosphate isomerase [Betaproteobacteria bacterium]